MRLRAVAVAGAVTAVSVACGPLAGDSGSTPSPSPNGPPESSRQVVTVNRIIDGDTIEVTASTKGPLPVGREVDVRLLEYNTVEEGHCGYERATEELADRLGTRVTVERDKDLFDRYGRYLLYVFDDGKLVNLDMVRDGWGDAILYEPNDEYWDRMRAADAREPWPGSAECDVAEDLS